MAKKCFKCNKKILKKSNHVDLITYVDGNITESISFHMNCWGVFNQDKVNERIRQMSGMGMDLIKQFVSNNG